MRFDDPSSAEELLALFRQGHRLTQHEAARQLGVSARQVRRLITRLREEGIDVREGRSGRTKTYFLPSNDLQVEDLPIGLTERQVLALVVAAEAARSALRPTPLSEPLGEAVSELLQHITPHVHTFEPDKERAHWHFGDAPSADLDPDVFETLTTAIDRQQPVDIDYFTASTGTRWEGRRINPLVLAAPGGSWVCVAYCHMREGLRDFSLAGIERVDPCTSGGVPDDFDRPEDFDPELYFRDRFGALAGDEIYEVRLLVEPDRAPYFERKEYHPTQQIEEAPEDRPDERMVVSYEVAGLKDVRAWVRSWGPGVKVVAPPELAAMVAEDAAATRAQYE
jgi:predicted DNA-binding transcriptional regulator YafY